MDVAGYTKTFPMDQGQVLGNDQVFHALYNAPLTDGKRNGICTGLSMIWAARRMMFHDETPTQRAAALVSMPGFSWGGRSQDIHVAAGSVGGSFEDQIRNNYTEALRAYVLRIRANSVVSGNGDEAAIASALAGAVKVAGSYHLYLLVLNTPGGIAGHMCASYASHGTLGMNRHFYFFDPNMGEYRVGANEAEALLKGVLTAYGSGNMPCSLALAFEVERG